MANINNVKQEILDLISDTITMHPKAFEEFSSIIAKSGHEASILKLLTKNLRLLSELNITQLHKLSNFEVLKNSYGLWSMHLSDDSLNIRMLFKYYNGYIILCAFHERDDSRNTSYQPYINIANQRFLELKE